MIAEINLEELELELKYVLLVGERIREIDGLVYPNPINDYQRGWNDAIRRIINDNPDEK